MNLRMRGDKIVNVRDASDLPHPLEYFDLMGQDVDGVAAILEGIAEENEHMNTLAVVYLALQEGLNLAKSWNTIKFVLHDLIRKTKPQAHREMIYTYKTSQLIETVCLFVEKYYV